MGIFPNTVRRSGWLSVSVSAALCFALLSNSGCFDSSDWAGREVAAPSADESLTSTASNPFDSAVAPRNEFERSFVEAFDRYEASLKTEGSAALGAPRAEELFDDPELDRNLHWIDGPTVITHPGIYRVEDDFSVSAKEGDGIVVRSNFVWLDLGGHTITGPGNKVGRGIAVEGARYVLVTHGELETFGIGVAFDQTRRSTVAFVRVQGGDEIAAPPANPPQIGVLLVNSAHNTLRWNEVNHTNLGVFVRGGESYRNLIANNEAVAGMNGLLAICYNPAMGEGDAGPSNDVVRRNLLSRFGTGIQTSTGSMYNRFTKNRIEYFVAPYNDFNGSNEFVDNTEIQLNP